MVCSRSLSWSAAERNASFSAQGPCSDQEMALPAFLPEAGELFAQPHSTATSSSWTPACQAPPHDKTWAVYPGLFAKFSPSLSFLPMKLLGSKAQRRKRTLAQHFAALKPPSHHSSPYLHQPLPCFPLPLISDLSEEVCRGSKQVLCHVVLLSAFNQQAQHCTCISNVFASMLVSPHPSHQLLSSSALSTG